jgi:DNA-binding NarL/FixJ family response regulator
MISKRILIVEDHPLFAEAIRGALENVGMLVVDISRAHEAVELVERFLPDVVLISLGLPDRSGLVAGRSILERWPETKILAVSPLNDRATADEAIRVGFLGNLHKDAPVPQLVSSIRSVLDGHLVAPGELSPDAEFVASQLSPQEQIVLHLLVQGSSGASISTTLGIGRDAVRRHVQSILEKLQVHSHSEAAAFAAQNRSVSAPIPKSRGETDSWWPFEI